MIKYKDETVVGDFPKADNYIDDTQPRADRMYSSEKITTDFAKKTEIRECYSDSIVIQGTGSTYHVVDLVDVCTHYGKNFCTNGKPNYLLYAFNGDHEASGITVIGYNKLRNIDTDNRIAVEFNSTLTGPFRIDIAIVPLF